ncbi:MAG: hypothetical protein WC422_05190 [Candidatus Paceibacterota bacterium]|jgi:hypothetical protein
MKKFILILVIISIIVFAFFFLNNSKKSITSTTTTTQLVSNEIVDCQTMENPSCFMNRMNSCLPVKGTLIGTDGTPIEISILGQENDKCHFQRKLNNVIDLNCYFPKGTMN